MIFEDINAIVFLVLVSIFSVFMQFRSFRFSFRCRSVPAD